MSRRIMTKILIPACVCTALFSSCLNASGYPSASPDASESPSAPAASADPARDDATRYKPQATEIPEFVSERTENDLALVTEGSELVQLQNPAAGEELVVLNTTMGVIKLRMFPQYAPKAVENFLQNARSGYYDNVIFHRVINEFMIQSGDPMGAGTGGSSVYGEEFETEIVNELHFIHGALGMAKTDAPVSQGSQFFIISNSEISPTDATYLDAYEMNQDTVATKEGEPEKLMKEFYPLDIINKYREVGGYRSLDYNYTVFGQVVEGIDVVDAINRVETDLDATSPTKDRPLQDVYIVNITFETFEG